MELVCPHCGAINRVPTERLQQHPKCGKCGAEVLPAHPVELTAASFEKFVSRNELPVLVDFWAPWCGPCRMIGPVIEQLAAENVGSVKVGKMNIDESPRTAAGYGVSSIPTLMVFKGGEVVDRFVGVQPKDRLQAALDEALE